MESLLRLARSFHRRKQRLLHRRILASDEKVCKRQRMVQKGVQRHRNATSGCIQGIEKRREGTG